MEKMTQAELDQAAMLMDDDIREDMSSNYEPGFDNPQAFIEEYKRRHAAKYGEEFSY